MLTYFLAKLYTDEEIQKRITELAEHGYIPDHYWGNILHCKKSSDAGSLCVITSECQDKDPRRDEQIQEQIAIMGRKNWRLCCVSSPDSLLPLRRRLIFQSSGEPNYPKPDEAIQSSHVLRARKTPRVWGFLWFVFFLLVFLTSVPFMLNEGFSLIFLLILASLSLLSIASFGLYSNRSRRYLCYTRQEACPDNLYRLFRRWEKLYLSTQLMLFLFVLLLFLGD